MEKKAREIEEIKDFSHACAQENWDQKEREAERNSSKVYLENILDLGDAAKYINFKAKGTVGNFRNFTDSKGVNNKQAKIRIQGSGFLGRVYQKLANWILREHSTTKNISFFLESISLSLVFCLASVAERYKLPEEG